MARALQKHEKQQSAGATPPASPEAEASVLGAVLLRPAVFDQVADLLAPVDFYRGDYRIIYQAMTDLRGQGAPVDLRTVAELLKERSQLQGLGGPDMAGEAFLMGLSDHVGITANVGYYAKLVWEKSQARKVKEKATLILHENSNGNFEEFMTWTESQILEVTTPALDRNRANSFPPLDDTVIPTSERLQNPPPPREYLFEGVLPSNIVGGIVAMGGTGKGHLNIMLGLSLATGENAGPLKPVRDFKVLYLAGEDSQEELDRRTIAAVEALWPDGPPPPGIDNFISISVMGKLGPLMQLDGAGNPVNAPAYDWLCKTLENLPDVEVLILDPKSKFYGLVENDNGHNAAWVNCMESLVARFNITNLFSHHESKAKAGNMEQSSSRGGSALTDGCRWVANIKTMDPETANKFQVADPRNYVVMDVTKSNYAPKLPAPIYFRRGEGGALSYVNLGSERVEEISDKLLNRLAEEEAAGFFFSRRDLLYEDRAKLVIDHIKKEQGAFNRVKDVNWAVDHLLHAGLLEEVKMSVAKTGPPKKVLRVVGPEGESAFC